MKLQDLLADLGSNMGLANLKLDSHGVCRLAFDAQTHVDLEADADDENTLIMHSVVGATPHESVSAFYQKLLSGNYLGRETAGAVLALDSGSGEVVLSKRVGTHQCDVEFLADKLTSFVRVARDWQHRLVPNQHHDETATAVFDPHLSGMIRI
ncbi:MAG: type III secretion system chaperone [Verrucomicrobiota bacterium]